LQKKNSLEAKEQELSGNETLCFLTAGRPFNFPVTMGLPKVSKWSDCPSQQLALWEEICKEREKHLYLDRAMIFNLQQELLVCFFLSPSHS